MKVKNLLGLLGVGGEVGIDKVPGKLLDSFYSRMVHYNSLL